MSQLLRDLSEHRASRDRKECHRSLDSTNLTEREREIYCKTCYGKLFGPTGYGYGGGAGTLSTDTHISDSQRFSTAGSREASQPSTPLGSNVALAGPRESSQPTAPSKSNAPAPSSGKPKFGGADKCFVCTQPVYFAEQVAGPSGQKMHKNCMKCTSCSKLVDSTTMCDREGKIYCRTDYNKLFGARGYGFAGVSFVANQSPCFDFPESGMGPVSVK
ncbi:hypothetical protein BDZ88DRAFT_454762 [Geranomyces variabilis]|nr:hypothetical protein BDZ88DRAFT_454762 [Geranomyces variabilis]KAJ3134186.1 hypothetical protein HDU90_005283 [Geranomyces variabilis]